MDNSQQDLIHLRPQTSDEIDIGELIRKLILEWKLVTLVTVIGAIASVVFALSLTSIYRVEAVVSAPTIAQMGTLFDQSLIPINAESSLTRVVETLFKNADQRKIFNESALFTTIAKETEATPDELYFGLVENLTIERIEREFYSIAEDQRSPFKEVSIRFESPFATEAALFVNTLAIAALDSSKESFTTDVITRKREKTTNLNITLKTLKEATEAVRLAEIERLEEQNRVRSNELSLELGLLEQQAKTNRLKRMAQLDEAIQTAAKLNIVEPITWEDLRPSKNSAQIFNDISGKAPILPLYFQGTRILSAERGMLNNRTNDLLYVGKSSEIEFQLDQLAADPKIAALKVREDDTIYIANYDELQTQLSVLANLSTDFSIASMGTLIQPAIASTKPIEPNRKMIAVTGTILAGFLGLFLALIRIAIKR